MSIIQFLGLVLSFAAISKVIADYRKKQESRVMFIFWFLLWLGVIAIIISPGILDFLILKVLGPRQSIGTLLGFGMIVILFLVYRVYIKAERVERILKKYVSDLALQDLKKNLKAKK